MPYYSHKSRRTRPTRTAVGVVFAVAVMLIVVPASATTRVVATLPALGALASSVGGDHVRVDVLAPGGQDAHFVDPRPSHIVALSRADLVVTNGMQLEDAWLRPLLLQSRNGDVQVGTDGYFEGGDCVEALQAGVALDRAAGDIHAGGNPHYLLDPRAGARVARCLGDRLGQIDRENAATYTRNAESLATALETFAATQSERFAALSTNHVVTYHDSMVYAWDWLGVHQVTTIEPRPGVAPGPARAAEVVADMRSIGARIIVRESYYPGAIAERIAGLVDGTVVTVSLDTPDGYQAQLTTFVDDLYEALSANP